MKLLDETMQELAGLAPDDMMRVNQLVHSLKRTAEKPLDQATTAAVEKARQVLKDVRGCISDDVIALRNESQ